MAISLTPYWKKNQKESLLMSGRIRSLWLYGRIISMILLQGIVPLETHLEMKYFCLIVMIAISSKCNLPNFVVTIHVFLGGMKEQNIGGKVHIQQECIGMQDTCQCSTATEKKK